MPWPLDVEGTGPVYPSAGNVSDASKRRIAARGVGTAGATMRTHHGGRAVEHDTAPAFPVRGTAVADDRRIDQAVAAVIAFAAASTVDLAPQV